MTDAHELIKQADVEKIAAKGKLIYAKIKATYEPKENGKFLAINTDTEEVYLGDTGAAAVQMAKEHYPTTVFYLVRIGYDVAVAMARLFEHKK